MIRPLRNRPIRSNRTRLLVGCGSAALALALVLAPQRATAQGFQADGTVVFGSAEIIPINPITTQIDVFTPTVVIDWTPQQDAVTGNDLDFLRTGATGIFQTSQLQNFAVLNRILPTTNGSIVVMNGSVISQLGNASVGFTPGGIVAFYSPTGILVGSTATFDVGSLLLTTLDTDSQNFDDFFNGGTLQLAAEQQGSTARIQINPGAQIAATRENSFFAVVAADVQMLGTARVNGSHAYVAGEVVNLRLSNGLFDISIPVGTAASGEVVTLDGDVGGPSSTGVGDNHLVYAVARASADPISMLFSGNLGFDPAQSAGIVNGEIILAANYNVSGRNVAFGAIGQDINTVRFQRDTATTAVRGDITLRDFNARSSMLAIGNGRTLATSINADSSVTGNLMLVGRQSAALDLQGPRGFTVSGDVLVDSRDLGVVGSGLQSLDVINAQGGVALINVGASSAVAILGNAVVAADGIGGVDISNGIAGTARAGSALIVAAGGSFSIAGDATITAAGAPFNFPGIRTGAEARGGLAQLFVSQGSSASIGQSLFVNAVGLGVTGDLSNPSTVSNAFGGQALLTLADPNSSISIAGNVELNASAFGGRSNNVGLGSIGNAGAAIADITGPGNFVVDGNLSLFADGGGNNNAGGTGGTGLGGRASIATVSGGTIRVRGRFDATAIGLGGSGQTGGDGFGGIAGANAILGDIAIDGSAFAAAEGFGGGANFGNGGNGGLGRGGSAFFQAYGNSSTPARLTIAGNASLNANGEGGGAGQSDGSAIVAGRGGDGFGGVITIPNQADPNFGSGAYLLAGGDYGTLSVTGSSLVVAQGVGGSGGAASGTLPAGKGGVGVGGLAQAGLELFGGSGAVGQGSATFSDDLILNASGVGGDGGVAVNSDNPGGPGGDGTGGGALVTVHAGDVVAGLIQARADGTGGGGGDGTVGGTGTGGSSGVFGSLGGALTLTGLTAFADGIGGFSIGTGATGGLGIGGGALLDAQGLDVIVNGDVQIQAAGFGGGADAGNGGEGRGGTARIGVLGTNTGNATVTGNAAVIANGLGAAAGNSFTGGIGQGGLAVLASQAGGTVRLGSARIIANGTGGSGTDAAGGAGTGGSATLRSDGIGTAVTVVNPTPFISAFGSRTMVGADGTGGAATGGTGVGGTGRGGQTIVSANNGASIALPIVTQGANGVITSASGIGGSSSVDGGVGGNGVGGLGMFEADNGATIVTGFAFIQPDATGGSSVQRFTPNPTINVSGGNAIGGERRIDIRGGATITGQFGGGSPGGSGGSGSGTGTGGDGTGGVATLNVDNATFNATGRNAFASNGRGGDGQIGGNGVAGMVNFTATDATINLLPGSGDQIFVFDVLAQGGTGVSQGGDASGGQVNIDVNASTITGGPLRFSARAGGGRADAAIGQGGNAIAGNLAIDIVDSVVDIRTGEDRLGFQFINGVQVQVTFPGDVSGIESTAIGGTGAIGGSATSGDISVAISGGSFDVGPSTTAAGNFDITANATGGTGSGGNGGNASGGSANVLLSGAEVAIDGTLTVAAIGTGGISAGATGGSATGGLAQLGYSGAAQVDADLIAIVSNAETSSGGSAQAGTSSLQGATGSQAVIDTAVLNLLADASGADPANNIAGRFDIRLDGGTINTGTFVAQALGDPSSLLESSQLGARGGSLQVTDSLLAESRGDIVVRTEQNGLIGNAVLTGNATAILIDAGGTIEILGESNSTGGLSGQTITIVAGRSILLDGSVAARDGAITLTANAGGGPAQGQPSVSVITMAQGSRIDAGSGTVTIGLLDGEGNPQQVNGAITLANITGGLIDVRNLGASAGSNISVLADGVLTASSSGRAIDLASLNGEVINLQGDAGLILTGGGHYGIFADTPTGSQIGTFGNYARRYNVANATAYDALNPGGNFAAFRIVPILTVTANDVSQFYGNATTGFTASFGGFLPGDSFADLLGAPLLTSLANSTSNVGLYTITAALGSLVSQQGYQFTFDPGQLTVTPRPITVTADNLTRVYGDANPALNFTVDGAGLVNGDQLSGAVATTAGLTTGVGTVAITQGTLAANANYALTFVDGELRITPRPITVTPNSFLRIYGNANPTLFFTVGEAGLVNGDQLSGALTTVAGVTTGVGSYAITQGTLAASDNYALTFVGRQLTIAPRPITVTADNLTRNYGNANPMLTLTVGGLGLVNGDQLGGALATAAGLTTGVGAAQITQGTLSGGANYAVSFVGGQLTITPRPIIITADGLAKLLGQPDPVLTYTVGGDGLVNNDRLSGSLTRDPGETIGAFAIRQGTLAAGPNYLTTFVAGELTIDAPPAPPEINNPIVYEGPVTIVDTAPIAEDEDEERYGVDFPDQPEAPLITEDPLLDDPVTSGGDASVYGGGTAPPAGGTPNTPPPPPGGEGN